MYSKQGKSSYAQALASAPIGMDILLMLPGLRGIYAMSNTDNAISTWNLAGQEVQLTVVSVPTKGIESFMGYMNYDGADDCHYSSNTALQISVEMSVMAFVYFDNTASALEVIVSKWNETGDRKTFRLGRTATGEIEAVISNTGADEFSATTVGQVGAGVWAYCGMSYDRNDFLKVYLGQLGGGTTGQLEVVSNTTAIPAGITANTSWFVVAGNAENATPQNATNFLDGRVSFVAYANSEWSDNIHNLLWQQLRQLLRV